MTFLSTIHLACNPNVGPIRAKWIWGIIFYLKSGSDKRVLCFRNTYVWHWFADFNSFPFTIIMWHLQEVILTWWLAWDLWVKHGQDRLKHCLWIGTLRPIHSHGPNVICWNKYLRLDVIGHVTLFIYFISALLGYTTIKTV